jgi:hypothetical protein
MNKINVSAGSAVFRSHDILRFIAVFRRLFSLLYLEPDESSPYPSNVNTVLIFYFARSVASPSDFLDKIMSAFLISPICTTYPTHLILLELMAL